MSTVPRDLLIKNLVHIAASNPLFHLVDKNEYCESDWGGVTVTGSGRSRVIITVPKGNGSLVVRHEEKNYVDGEFVWQVSGVVYTALIPVAIRHAEKFLGL